MKRAYVRPTMVGERFVANEYVAACGDPNKMYKFECNAGDGYYSVYLNGLDGKPGTSDDDYIGEYHKCGAKHEAKKTDDFSAGYIQKSFLGLPYGERTNVMVWRGEDGSNIHCTTKLNMSEWETVKS